MYEGVGLARNLAMALLLLSVFCAVTVINQSFSARKLYADIESAYQQQLRLEKLKGQLRIEHGTWVTPAEIEQRARGELGMVAPEERVTLRF